MHCLMYANESSILVSLLRSPSDCSSLVRRHLTSALLLWLHGVYVLDFDYTKSRAASTLDTL